MAMPRPSGKAQKIAEKVVPGLANRQKKKSAAKRKRDSFLSEVEIKQTREITEKIPYEKARI